MWHRLSVFWYYFRVGPLFTFLQYLGRGVVGISILVGITFTISAVLSIFGHTSKETVEAFLWSAIAVTCVGYLILCISVVQLPNKLPPDKQPRR